MATTLDEFEFKGLGSSGGSHYDQFLDGQIWKLTSADSPTNASLRSMQTTLAGQAKRRNLRIRTQVLRDKNGEEKFLVVQMQGEREEDK